MINPNTRLRERADQYFLMNDASRHKVEQELIQLESDLNQIKTCESQLSPNYPNAANVSERRKINLQERVNKAYERIEKQITEIEVKLNPSIAPSPRENFDRQMTALKDLMQKLDRGSSKEFHTALKSLPKPVLDKIHHMVWMVHGCPLEREFSERIIRNNPKVLHSDFGWHGCCQGKLFEQVEADLRLDFELEEKNREKVGLEALLNGLNTSQSADEIKGQFLALPERTQRRICEDAAKIRFRWCADEVRNAILGDATCLRGIRGLLGGTGLPVVEQILVWVTIELQERAQGKVDFFKNKESNIEMTHKQMKQLFKAMHPLVCDQLQRIGLQLPFFGRGFNPKLHETLGAHYNRDTQSTTFRVYAPNACEVHLHLTHNRQVQKSTLMYKGEDGVWSTESKGVTPGQSYHFMVTGKNGGHPVKKIDPFALRNIMNTRNIGKGNHNFESIVLDADLKFEWEDEAWVNSRPQRRPSHYPMTIYEIHAPSWKKDKNGNIYNWKDLAPILGGYCKNNGYNAIELMALFEHPEPESMGYQLTSYFAPNSEMGTWQDFQCFVNYMHNQQITIIADWVPAHFATDSFALANFDGSHLLEVDSDGPTSIWGSYLFDFKKRFVQDFLSSNVDFLFKQLHIDGIRVDAVKDMLFTHMPAANRMGREGNPDVKNFFRNLNTYVHKRYPGALMIAEESYGYANLTRPTSQRGKHTQTYGIGFDLTWHMGFMNDTLHQFWKYSGAEKNQLIKLSENYSRTPWEIFKDTVTSVDGNEDIRPRGSVVLCYSHDECANGKGSVFENMAGKTRSDKFSNGRLALAYQSLRGGGAVLDCMGNELLQSDEWHGRLKQSVLNLNERHKTSVQWEELDRVVNPTEYLYHLGAQSSRRDLNLLFLKNAGLWDQTNQGFGWFADDQINCVLSFYRRGRDQKFICVFNTSDRDLQNYPIQPIDHAVQALSLNANSKFREVYNTDNKGYGGEGRLNQHIEVISKYENWFAAIRLRLPPYTAIVLEHVS